MIEKTNNELLEFQYLMEEVSKLSPELIRRFSDIAQGIIIGSSLDKNKA